MPSNLSLRPREQEIAELLARGYSYKQIARELGISFNTVKSSLNSAYLRNDIQGKHASIRLIALVVEHLKSHPEDRLRQSPGILDKFPK